MLSAYDALEDIVGYVYSYDRPIHHLSHLGLCPISHLMYVMQISKGAVEQLQGNTDSCPLEEKA